MMRTAKWVTYTCTDCGVTFDGPPNNPGDGLCGSNCRAIRAEIAAELESVPEPEEDEDIGDIDPFLGQGSWTDEDWDIED